MTFFDQFHLAGRLPGRIRQVKTGPIPITEKFKHRAVDALNRAGNAADRVRLREPDAGWRQFRAADLGIQPLSAIRGNR